MSLIDAECMYFCMQFHSLQVACCLKPNMLNASGFSQNVRLVVSRHMQLPHRLEMIPGIVDISAMRSACSAINVCAVQHPDCGRLGRLIEIAGDRTRSVEMQPHIF